MCVVFSRVFENSLHHVFSVGVRLSTFRASHTLSMTRLHVSVCVGYDVVINFEFCWIGGEWLNDNWCVYMCRRDFSGKSRFKAESGAQGWETHDGKVHFHFSEFRNSELLLMFLYMWLWVLGIICVCIYIWKDVIGMLTLWYGYLTFVIPDNFTNMLTEKS